MPLKGYKNLIVWQKSMQLIAEVYRLVKILPKAETYALSDQMRRAVISIASNIAEGQGRDSTREYVRFLNIARGSCFELETQLNACLIIEYFTERDTLDAFGLVDEIGKILTTMINKLNKKLTPNP